MQIATIISRVLLLVFVSSLPFQTIMAKAATHRKYKKLEGILDTSLVPEAPPKFKIKIKYSNFVYPKDPSPFLHGNNREVGLTAEANKDVLRGQIAIQNRQSIINTKEHDVKPRFSAELHMLVGKYAPDIEHLMETEIAAARLRTAALVEHQRELMDKELSSLPPTIDLPTPHSNASPEQEKALQSQLEQSNKPNKQDLYRMDIALSHTPDTGKIPSAPRNELVIPWGDPKSLPGVSIPLPSKIDTSSSQKQMEQLRAAANLPLPILPSDNPTQVCELPRQKQAPKRFPKAPASVPVPVMPPIPKVYTPQIPENMAKPNLQIPLKSVDANLIAQTLKGKLAPAQKKAQDLLNQAQQVMDTILTSMRPVPPIHLSSTPKAEPIPEDEESTVIEWNEWHANFAKLAQDPILKFVNKSGNPSGVNTVQITVSPHQKVVVSLFTKSDNNDFDQAILQAYNSLDGNPALKYPAGSRRPSITFLVDNKHTDSGVASGVTSETSLGDKEILRFHR